MNRIKAAIFDLDGVVTRTATIHAKAWKQMFDDYNEKRKTAGEEPFEEFSIEKDYPTHLDGMPRLDGIANFLRSRAISIPKGDPHDGPDASTMHGLGARKNAIYHELLKDGVEVFEKNVAVIRKWKEAGLKTAIISSSKNCKRILEITGLEDLFEVRVDGVISVERNLNGKPAPDIFLEAARELKVIPREALIVEDALAGVEAGKRGGFQLVIGIGNNEKAMKEKGAHQVVQDLGQVKLERPLGNHYEHLPSALENFNTIAKKIKDRNFILCLDYDGTLTPIVEHYDKAIITDEMRDLVHEISRKVPVAIISGRDIPFIKKHVRLPDAYYAGSHGFQIIGPNGFHHELDEAKAVLPILDRVEEELKAHFPPESKVEIERKSFAMAVHFRNADEKIIPEVKSKLEEVLQKHKELKAGKGKMVIELKPAIDWHKGKALEMIRGELDKEGTAVVAYIGDDVTDEDAFQAINDGVAVLVGAHEERTVADHSLKDVDEVAEFLRRLNEILSSTDPAGSRNDHHSAEKST